MVWWNPATWKADPKWSVLSGLPSVQFRMVFLCLLDLLTIIGVAHTVETIMHNGSAAQRADPLVLEIWIAWFTLLGGMHGLGYAGYRTKRNTSWDGNLEEDRGKPSSGEPERPVIAPDAMKTGEMRVPTRLPDGAPIPTVSLRTSPAEPSD